MATPLRLIVPSNRLICQCPWHHLLDSTKLQVSVARAFSLNESGSAILSFRACHFTRPFMSETSESESKPSPSTPYQYNARQLSWHNSATRSRSRSSFVSVRSGPKSRSRAPLPFHQSQSYIAYHCRCYQTSSKLYRKKIADPRTNVQYPFLPGDPQQADMISNVQTEHVRVHEKVKQKRDRIRLTTQAKVADGLRNDFVNIRDNNDQRCLDSQFESLDEKDIKTHKLGKMILGERRNRVRRSSDIIVLEGSRLVKDALLAGAKALCLCFCRSETVEQLAEARGLLNAVKLYKISPGAMKTFSDTVTPGGLLGVFKKPNQGEAVRPPETTLPITLIFDSLKDPGNAGTLIRTAAAIGCKQIFATEGCVNLWERKVLRAAMGAHFSVPIYSGISWTQVKNYLDPQVQVLLANNYTAASLGHAFDVHLDAETLKEGLGRESLDNKVSSEAQRNTFSQEAYELEQDTYQFHDVPLPVYEYSEVPLGQDHGETSSLVSDHKDWDFPVELALVIGSEAAGLSESAKLFAFERYGAYVTIPMNETTNSLNSAIAGSIIMYELRKKVMKFL